jgi:hypothetical protein
MKSMLRKYGHGDHGEIRDRGEDFRKMGERDNPDLFSQFLYPIRSVISVISAISVSS